MVYFLDQNCPSSQVIDRETKKLRSMNFPQKFTFTVTLTIVFDGKFIQLAKCVCAYIYLYV